MNKKSIVLAASALAIIVSCNVREDVLPLSQKTAFKAVMADVPPTKTVLQSDGSVFWSPGDAINLFYGDAVSTKMVFDSSATSAAAQASFAGSLPAGFSPSGTDNFWAVYPYSRETFFDGSSVTLYLPEVQTAVEGTFADDLFVSLARSTGYELSFYNLCGGIKFRVTTPGITSVTFQGNAGEVLAGQVKVIFDDAGKPQVSQVAKAVSELRLNAPNGGFEVGKWYYIVSLPATLSAGYTMTFYQGDEPLVGRSVDTPAIIKRSVWGRIADADVVDSGSQPNKEIWYTSTDGNVVEPFMASGFEDVEIVSNTYENGKGIIRFNTAVGYINASAFTGCHTLETISLPTTSWLSGNPFTQCENLRAIYGHNATDDNRFWIQETTLISFAEAGLTKITVPEGVTRLGSAAFFTCYNLEEINLPSTLGRISSSVFAHCTSLTQLTIPESVSLIESYAFQGCTNLVSLTVLRTSPPKISGSEILQNSDNCYIYVPAESVDAYKTADGWSEFADFIYPIEGSDLTASKYLTFTSEGTTTLSLTNIGDNAPVLYYSTDAQTWTQWDYSALTISANAPLYICGDNPDGFNGTNADGEYCASSFAATGDNFAVSGDVMSLLDGASETAAELPDLAFYKLFDGCTLLTSAPELSATTLTNMCYANMFEDCTGLSTAPELPATTLAEWCYSSMFQGCTSLTTAPDLPASTLTSGCYAGMFQGCSSLSVAPDLPATTLAGFCYSNMFAECPSLSVCPSLPATIMDVDCYMGMFSQCTSLTSAPELPSTSLAEGCYAFMFNMCSGLTMPPSLPATTLVKGCYMVMFGSCTSLTAAPSLPASTLAEGCYSGMFGNCFQLNSVECLATDVSASGCLDSWLSGVASTGTFVKSAQMTAWPTGASGIPSGWTVEDAQ